GVELSGQGRHDGPRNRTVEADDHREGGWVSLRVREMNGGPRPGLQCTEGSLAHQADDLDRLSLIVEQPSPYKRRAWAAEQPCGFLVDQDHRARFHRVPRIK